MNSCDNPNSGQTIIILLVFMMMSITLALSATAVIIINTRTDTAAQQGEQALHNAETGVENALLQLERDNTYTGETMTLDGSAATISISGTSTKTIVAQGTSGSFIRTVTATVSISSNVLTITSWSETP